MSDESKDIQIVEGDGSELNISPVYDHINDIGQPRKKQKEGIVIPEVKKKEDKKDNKCKNKKDKEEKKEDNNEDDKQ